VKKIINISNSVDRNNNNISKLDNKIFQKTNFIWDYHHRSLILLENFYSSSFEAYFTVSNISEDMLPYIKPVFYITNGVLTDVSGLEFGSAISGKCNNHLLYLGGNMARLYMNCQATALTQSFNAIPVFWNIKLVYKPTY